MSGAVTDGAGGRGVPGARRSASAARRGRWVEVGTFVACLVSASLVSGVWERAGALVASLVTAAPALLVGVALVLLGCREGSSGVGAARCSGLTDRAVYSLVVGISVVVIMNGIALAVAPASWEGAALPAVLPSALLAEAAVLVRRRRRRGGPVVER